jgi:hypothetical protein
MVISDYHGIEISIFHSYHCACGMNDFLLFRSNSKSIQMILRFRFSHAAKSNFVIILFNVCYLPDLENNFVRCFSTFGDSDLNLVVDSIRGFNSLSI